MDFAVPLTTSGNVMLIFIKDKQDKLDVIIVPKEEILLVKENGDSSYKEHFKKINILEAVPWFSIEKDPLKFAQLLLKVASKDKVCLGVLSQAKKRWNVDFSIENGYFSTKMVQEQYLKQLKNWLNPLSGNINRNTSHTVNEDALKNLAKSFNLEIFDLKEVTKNKFFDLKIEGRRDRMQVYRNITEAARAIIGEVTTWPSRQVEKMVALSLLGSEGLAFHQRIMLAEASKFEENFKCTMWEYLPYYLRGKVLEKKDESFCKICVLGALHDCLMDDSETKKLANEKHIQSFKELNDGVEYKRWRLLPNIIRYQVMISDLARIFNFGKQDCDHSRIEADFKFLNQLPESLKNKISCSVRSHKSANPHDPGIPSLKFLAGWNRNEFCPNVVTSRLLLAPLYAGTSGHTQGRILTWRQLQEKGAKLKNVPVGLVIATGYAVLWRLYYDKRVSGFHTFFEALQGVNVDNKSKVEKINKHDVIWNILADCSESGKLDVCLFWDQCLDEFGHPGRGFELTHKESLNKIRQDVMKKCPQNVILHWSKTDDTENTAPEVSVWTEEKNENEILFIYKEWLEIAANTPLPEPDEEEIEFFKKN